MTTHTELAAQAREALLKLADQVWLNRYTVESIGICNLEAFAELIRAAALESPERVQGEPVAYAVMLPSGRVSRTRNTAERAQRHVDDWNRRYPRPPHAYVAPLGVLSTTPPPQAERVPLSDEQVEAILREFDPSTRRLPPGIAKLARAIERAHGITPKEGT